MAFTMLTRRRRFAVLLVLAAAIALTVSTLIALGVRGPATAHAAVRHANKVHHAGKMPAGESSQEPEQGQPGEPAAGHADPSGSAGSDCTGNCVQ
jgi:hypothetical protein